MFSEEFRYCPLGEPRAAPPSACRRIDVEIAGVQNRYFSEVNRIFQDAPLHDRKKPAYKVSNVQPKKCSTLHIQLSFVFPSALQEIPRVFLNPGSRFKPIFVHTHAVKHFILELFIEH